MPWFAAPNRATTGQPIAFGHWSTLGEVDSPDVLPLDTGCVWGGRLTMARIGSGPAATNHIELIAVSCPQAQKPGR